MKTYLKALISLLAVFTFLLSFNACATCELEAGTDEVVKKSFEVGEGGTLFLDSDIGKVVVETHSSNRVDVEVVMTARTSSDSRAQEIFEKFDLDFNKSGNNVHIDGDFNRRNGLFSWMRGNRLRVRYNITVPKKYNLDIKTSGGSITINDLLGNATARTSGGSIQLGYIDGVVRCKTSGGKIVMQGCNGDAEVTTSGGRIELGEVKGEVKARTSGGSIKVKEVMGMINASTSGGSVSAHISKQPEGNCRLTTSGGSISVYLVDGIKLDVDAKTSGGSVKTDFPVTVQGKISSRKLQAKINGGGPELYLRTSGGSIRINKLD